MGIGIFNGHAQCCRGTVCIARSKSAHLRFGRGDHDDTVTEAQLGMHDQAIFSGYLEAEAKSKGAAQPIDGPGCVRIGQARVDVRSQATRVGRCHVVFAKEWRLC